MSPLREFWSHLFAAPMQYGFSRRLALCGGLLVLAACGRSDGSVTISGDVEGLDTLALRGDALLLQAERRPQFFDSLQLAVSGAGAATRDGAPSRPRDAAGGGASDSASPAPAPKLEGVALITARARARGDSMARAAAGRLTGGGAAGARARADTVRGIVTLIGVAPAQQVVLRTDNGSNTVALSGMGTSGLAKLAGLELVIRGLKVTPRDLVVSDFIVRSADGVPAYDGRLTRGKDGAYLQLTDGSGRKRIASLPPLLRGLDGVRVWIAIAPDAVTPHRYGLITRP